MFYTYIKIKMCKYIYIYLLLVINLFENRYFRHYACCVYNELD